MSNLVDITGHNEALDAEWFCNLFGKDVSSLNVRECLGVAGDVIDMGQLIFGKYRLVLSYDKDKHGLHQLFPSEDSVKEYINADINNAFHDAIIPYRDGIFLLNIASVENFGAFSWKNAGKLLDKQLKTYMPIIQKFMVDALTDSLNIEEQSQ